MTATKKPIRFKRMEDALFEQEPCGAQLGGGSSSGSDYFPTVSLSDLVNSFIQKVGDSGDGVEGNEELDNDDSDDGSSRKELLKKLLGYEGDDDDTAVGFRRNIIEEIEVAFRDQIISIDPKDLGFKRRLMAHLRQRGYDAGLCKSRWEKTGRYPAGSYEYVDMIADGGSRYIVEVNPAGQFEIARPTESYKELLEEFPHIFVGKPQTLKQMVRLMSAAIKDSLKRSGLEVAPWRRNAYLQAQWFSPYKRTTNIHINATTSSTSIFTTEANNKIRRTVVGFVEELNLSAAQEIHQGLSFHNCRRGVFSTKAGIRIGLLAAAFQPK